MHCNRVHNRDVPKVRERAQLLMAFFQSQSIASRYN